MKKRFLKLIKNLSLPIAFVACSIPAKAQHDSVRTLFTNPPHIHLPFRYSYLKWDLGYSGFYFNNTYLGGLSLDIIGAVFNDDIGLAIGIDNAGNRGGRYISPVPTVQSYSSTYFKIEPMLFPERLFNLSVPLKFSLSTLSYPNPNATTGYGRRARYNGYNFTAFTIGLHGFLNLFTWLSMGAGADYRFGFGSSGNVSLVDYSNFSFSILMRVKIFTRKAGKGSPAGADYYSPQLKYK